MGRRFGQHFLFRKSILDRIAEAACGDRAPRVVEIGPGKGALTESLLERADTVIAIEVDPHLVHYLHQKFREPIEEGRLEVIEGDVLKSDISGAVIAGNLPYYITSPILEKVFGLGEAWNRAVFMMQSEVAERLTAKPGNRDFGYLSVQTQIYARPEILFEVPRDAFRPPPKVDSAVVLLERRSLPEVEDPISFLKFASLCFRHKRKTLRNNLAPLYELASLPEGRLRAEQMSISELAALWAKIRSFKAPQSGV
ncbi:MAG TPA: 16S rRNA (adenine(1518)-N(6)/adenine(1519)-N(6))-dimethyltransferase RsmA [Bryobacteraceae bacterium]|nr:16S rRNA (adenine(1518)-N(6)/adenine(1519)-N(6))-dimethyltransferase RsmA [Bryobacteraceae bacterium]